MWEADGPPRPPTYQMDGEIKTTTNKEERRITGKISWPQDIFSKSKIVMLLVFSHCMATQNGIEQF